MFTGFRDSLRPALLMLLLFTLLTGLAYPLAITGIAQVALPAQANGSLVKDGDRIVGSELIGQGFAAPRYFHSRPSGAGKGYDATSSSGTNLGAGSKDLRDAIETRVAAARADGATGGMPADLVTSSASGLDPDVSPEAALAQVARVAKVRGLPEDQVRALVTGATKQPIAGFLGQPRVNVLMLNRALDGRARG